MSRYMALQNSTALIAQSGYMHASPPCSTEWPGRGIQSPDKALQRALWTAVTCHRFGNSASSRAVAGDKSPAEGKRRQVGALQKRGSVKMRPTHAPWII